MRKYPVRSAPLAALVLCCSCSSIPAPGGIGKKSSAVVVSSTPAPLSGVIHFHGGFVPDSIQVDAHDGNNVYTATTRPFGATQGGNGCAVGSSDWCYTIQVESEPSLATSYVLRPIAYIARQNPYQVARIPFSPSAAVPLNGAGTPVTAPDIDYTPAVVTGTFAASDIGGNPLSILSDYMSFNDNSNTFVESCGGSADFCPYNSEEDGVSPTYSAYLQPGSDYNFLTQAFSIVEGPQAQTDARFDGNLHLGTLGAGQVLVANRIFSETAEVTGSAQLQSNNGPVPIYNLSMNVFGSSTTIDPVTNAALNFGSNYRTTNAVGQGAVTLQNTNYVGRLFSNADLAKPVYLQADFTISSDGGTHLTFPPFALDFSQSHQIVRNFNNNDYASIASRVTLVPPYPIKNGVYPGVQAIESEPSGSYGAGQTTYVTDANGASFVIPAFGTPAFSGNWNLWRFGWNLDLGDPNFTNTYFVGQFLPITVQVASGTTVTAPDFVFPTAFVKVFYSAPAVPAGTTITDPRLSAYSDDGDSANSEGLNQNNVITGETRMVLRAHNGPNGAVAFHLTPSAVINAGGAPGTSRTDFSPITLFPHGGDVTVVGVPGSIALTITAPQENQVFPICQIPVTGLSTGQPNIGITVNGQSVAAPSTNNPGDPLQVGFSTTLTPPPGPLTISVTALDANGHTVTDVRHVSCLQALNHPPAITCPPTDTGACTSAAGRTASVPVAISDPDNDALQITWTVDGNLVKTDATAPGAASDTYTGVFSAYGHTVVATASDGKGGTASCTAIVNVPNPVVHTMVQTSQLLTPNHTMVNVGWQFNVQDKCANVATRVVKVYSNEADVVPNNIDGQYSPDAKVVNLGNTQVTTAVKVRAERVQNGPGRVYLIIHTVTDLNGSVGYDCSTVTVPLDGTPGNLATVNALAQSASTSCKASGVAPNGYVQVGTGPVIGSLQ